MPGGSLLLETGVRTVSVPLTLEETRSHRARESAWWQAAGG